MSRSIPSMTENKMSDKKSYVNYMNEVNHKMISHPSSIIANEYIIPGCSKHNKTVHTMNLYYPDVWYGTSWVVQYILINGRFVDIDGKCIGGAYIYTEIENSYPRPNIHFLYKLYRDALTKKWKKENCYEQETEEEI